MKSILLKRIFVKLFKIASQKNENSNGLALEKKISTLS